MKDLLEVLWQKEMDIARVRREIEALHQVIPLLAEERTGSNTGWFRRLRPPSIEE